MATFSEVFSLVAFFIFLRETLEASVIVAVLLQCMNRTMPRLKRWVWWGAFSGILASALAGGVFAIIYYVAKSKLFQGTGKLIFQGCISYVACILITYLGFAMLRFANIEQKVARKLDQAAEKALARGDADADGHHRRHAWSVFLLAFTAVLREGIESIVFLAGVGSNTAWTALPLACLAGLVVGLAIGAAVYYGGRSIRDLRVFFALSTFLLFFIAAGQVSLGTQLLSVAGAFGPYAPWTDQLTWQYRPVADLTGCCNDDPATGNQFFVLARAVFGFQARPTPMILVAYCTYWAAVTAALLWKWRSGSLFDADYKRKRKAAALRRKVARLEAQLARDERRAAAAALRQGGGGGAEAAAAEQRRAALGATRAALEAEEARLAAEDEAAARRLGLTPEPPQDEAAERDLEMAVASGEQQQRQQRQRQRGRRQGAEEEDVAGAKDAAGGAAAAAVLIKSEDSGSSDDGSAASSSDGAVVVAGGSSRRDGAAARS